MCDGRLYAFLRCEAVLASNAVLLVLAAGFAGACSDGPADGGGLDVGASTDADASEPDYSEERDLSEEEEPVEVPACTSDDPFATGLNPPASAECGGEAVLNGSCRVLGDGGGIAHCVEISGREASARDALRERCQAVSYVPQVWSDEACPRERAIGACQSAASDGGCDTAFYFPSQVPAEAWAVMCGASGDTWTDVSPDCPSFEGRGQAPLPPQDLCAGFIAAWCDAVARCECRLEWDLTCRLLGYYYSCGAEAGDIGGRYSNARVLASIDAGRIEYDPEAAGALLDNVRSSVSCDTRLSDLGLTQGEMRTLMGTFTGTLPEGESCDSGVWPASGGECATGVCTHTDDSGVTHAVAACRPLPAEGESCFSLPCYDRDRLSTDPDALRCGSDSATPSSSGPPDSYTCRRPLGDGEACDMDYDCQSGHCDGECGRLSLAEGGSVCHEDTECASGYCECPDGYCNGQAGTCAETDNPNGADCYSNAMCTSGYCANGTCNFALCDDLGGM